jgi:hypothetical protein
MRRMAWAIVWFAAACGGPAEPDPGDDDDDDDDSTKVDARVVALGGCTATRDTVYTATGEPQASDAFTWDANGDLTRQETLYSESGNVTVHIREYGAPHEVSFYRVNADGDDNDSERHYTWEDGNLVEIAIDYDADGVIDEIQADSFDDLNLWSGTRWDYDADGVFDDVVTVTWEPTDDGYHGLGEGEDPYGLYTTETWADADAWMYHYVYEDDRGVNGEWELSPRNDLGLSAHIEDRTFQLGVFSTEEVIDRTFDDEDRELTLHLVLQEGVEGEAPTTFDVTSTSTYDCG